MIAAPDREIRLNIKKIEAFGVRYRWGNHYDSGVVGLATKTMPRCPVTIYLLMTILGLAMFFGGRYTDRTIARHEPALARIEPAIPRICFVAKSAGMMIAVAGFGATVSVIAWS